MFEGILVLSRLRVFWIIVHKSHKFGAKHVLWKPECRKSRRSSERAWERLPWLHKMGFPMWWLQHWTVCQQSKHSNSICGLIIPNSLSHLNVRAPLRGTCVSTIAPLELLHVLPATVVSWAPDHHETLDLLPERNLLVWEFERKNCLDFFPFSLLTSELMREPRGQNHKPTQLFAAARAMSFIFTSVKYGLLSMSMLFCWVMRSATAWFRIQSLMGSGARTFLKKKSGSIWNCTRRYIYWSSDHIALLFWQF